MSREPKSEEMLQASASSENSFGVEPVSTDPDESAQIITMEAENGELSGLEVVQDSSASGGAYVDGFDSSDDVLKVKASIPESGTYMIKVKYKTYGGDKPNFLFLNGEKLSDYTFKDTSVWREAVIGQFDLPAGDNEFTIQSSWGWIAVDRITFVGGSGGSVSKVELLIEGGHTEGAADEPVTLIATADNAAEYRFFVRKNSGDWEPISAYSLNFSIVWVPETPGSYEIKAAARGFGSEEAAEQTLRYTALANYIGKPLVHGMFSDHMILQRDEPADVWGWSKPGQEISVSFNKAAYKAVADEQGEWRVSLGNYPAGGGTYTLKVSDGERSKEITNILFGDVWLASGQSNMEFTLSGTLNAAEEIANANQEYIRFIKIPNQTSPAPIRTLSGDTLWQQVTSESAPQLSAAAYFFTRALQQELDVPMGIIFSSVGGTKAESWTSYEKLQTLPQYVQSSRDIRSGVAVIDMMASPIALYNGMIAPIGAYPIKGVFWYQGESNWGEHSYYKLLPALIDDWRTQFNKPELPFLVVQISSYGALQSESNPAQPDSNPGLPVVRDAQLHTMLNDKHVGLIVTTDIGDPEDIHPLNKQDVGLRAATYALGTVYQQPIEYSGPIYSSMSRQGAAIALSFRHTGSGLMIGKKEGLLPVEEVMNGELQGFAIAGKDGQYVWAKAVIKGDQVIVSSETVADPVSVKYSWNDSAVGNLYNREGLPAAPFRTDRVHTLKVVNGAGSGTYSSGDTVTVTAELPNEGMEFHSWMGDIQYLQDASKQSTTLIIPDVPYLSIAPLYIEK